jgi:arsenate reductase (thioredoxin)
MKKKKILVLCTGNSCRSQMAEGWIRYYSGDAANVWSAGIESHGLNTYAVKSMMDAVIDISKQQSKTIEELPDIEFDFIITLCDEAKEKCPVFSGGGEYIHRSFTNPLLASGTEEEKMVVFNSIRDEIEDFVFDFVHVHVRTLIPDDVEKLLDPAFLEL